MRDPQRLPSATALRLLAAWLVLYGHSYNLLGTSTPPLPWDSGHAGLAIFFCLSGFMVSRSAWRSRSALDFAARRVRRLLPAFLAVSLGAILLWGFLSRGGFPGWGHPHAIVVRWARMLASGAHWELPGLFERHAYSSINGSLWSLPYEILLYAVLALSWFPFAKLRGGRLPSALWFACFAFVLLGSLPDPDLRLLGFRLRYLVLFSGFFLGGWSLSFLPAGAHRRLPFALIPLGLAKVASLAGLFPFLDPLALDLLIFPLGTLWIARSGPPAFDRLPDWSYGLYLWAWPVQQVWIELFPSIAPARLVVATTLSTLPLAALSWRWVERPFLARSRSG